LGGQLGIPSLSWKYSWIEAIFGWPLAKRARIFLPGIRWSLKKTFDKALFRMESRRVAAPAQH